MNSGFSDFQDLLNVTTGGQQIDDIQTELKSLEEEVADNTTDIASNLLAINNNTTAISNNGVLINNNTSNIATNTSNLALETLRISVNANEILQHDGEINTLQLDRISDLARITTNEQGIQTNTIALTTLGNDVLRKDGSVPLDAGYTPGQPQGIATKTYVDNSIGGSTQFLKIDGSNSMTGDLELNGNDLKIDGNVSKLYIENFSNNLVMASQNNLMFVRAGAIDAEVTAAGINFYKLLDMGQQNITNAALINGYNLSTFNSDIVTNVGNISTNTNAISTNVGNIAVNTNAISTNAGNIAANTSAISTKLPLAGGTMSGAINMDNNGIFNVSYLSSYGDITTNNYIKTNLLFPISGTDIFIPGSAGIRPSFIQSNFGTNSLLCKSDLDMQANDITNVGLVDGFDLATFDSNITTLATNLGNETVARISADAVLAGDISTNTSNISTNTSNISTNTSNISTNSTNISNNTSNISTNTTAIATKLPSSGSSITASTQYFKIDGGANDCELRICADSANNSGAKNPKLVFQQDGTVQSGAIWTGNNQLNLSSSTSSNAGIVFRTTNTAGAWETAAIRMMVENDGQVSIYTNLVVSSSKNFNVGNFRYYAYGGYGGYASGTINCAIRCLNGRCVAAEFDATSDRRCKTDIENIPDAKVDAFMRLEAKQYYWKDEKESLKYGFIAQDVIKQDIMSCVNFAESKGMAGGVDPETGVNNPADICMNLNYDSMIPLLQKSLKRSMDRTAALENRLEILENKIAAMV